MLRKGFSLIELMVVISIIGVLVAVGAASYTTAQKKGRDASRRAEIRAIQQGLEQYYTQNSGYPQNDTCSQLFADATFIAGGRPVDPKNTDPYIYSFSCTPSDADTYCVCARLENEQGNDGAGNCSYAANGSGDKPYFCVSNQQ